MKVRQDAWSEEDDLLLAETVLRHVREGSTQLNAFEEVGDELNRTSAACGFRWNAVVRHNYEKALQLAKKQRKQRQRAIGQNQPVKKRLLYTPPAQSIDELEMELEKTLGIEQPSEQTMNTNQSNAAVSEQSQTDQVKPSQQDEEQIEDTGDEQPLAKLFEDFSNARQNYAAEQSQDLTPNHVGRPSPSLTIEQVISYLESLKTTTRSAQALKQENERLRNENKELYAKKEELEQKIAKLEQNTNTIQEDYETLMNIMNRARKLALFEEEERTSTKFKMDRNGNLEKVAE